MIGSARNSDEQVAVWPVGNADDVVEDSRVRASRGSEDTDVGTVQSVSLYDVPDLVRHEDAVTVSAEDSVLGGGKVCSVGRYEVSVDQIAGDWIERHNAVSAGVGD